jgi:tetratricopeptide (TPR) repeat protein
MLSSKALPAEQRIREIEEGFKIQGKYDEAVKSYDKEIEINPQFAGAWYNRGIALVDQGKYDEATQSLDKAIEINPNDTETLYTKGTILISLGNYIEAERYFDEILKLDPTDANSLYGKACCLVKRDEIENALNYLEKAINLGGKEYADGAKTDKDFESIKNNGRFVNLVNV